MVLSEIILISTTVYMYTQANDVNHAMHLTTNVLLETVPPKHEIQSQRLNQAYMYDMVKPTQNSHYNCLWKQCKAFKMHSVNV